ncbi:putative Ig domain-containing protein, partial [bacterium]|nr:putative Ig domain-containing protein [bacterium]
MNIKIKKFFVLFFSLTIVLSVQASRTLRTKITTPPSEVIISESENYEQSTSARIKRSDSSSSLKIENIPFGKNIKLQRSRAKRNSERKAEKRTFCLSEKITEGPKPQNRISRVSNFSPENKSLIVKEKVSRKFNKSTGSLRFPAATFDRKNHTKNYIAAREHSEFVELNRKSTGSLLSPASTSPFADDEPGNWYQYFFDGFEGAFPDFWQLYGTPTWGPTDVEASTGSKSAWCAGYDYSPAGNYFDNMDAWMIEGPFDLSASEDALLFFDMSIKSQPEVDKLFVGLSTDEDNFSGNVYTGDSGGWITNVYIDAKNYAYSNSVYIGFQFYSNETISNYAGGFVDNIELMGYELVSNTQPDLAVQNAHITDSFNGIFNFEIKNESAQNQPADSYYISVFVDDELDSKETNQYDLASGATTTWDWQFAYYYLPGTHTVKIHVEPEGDDVNTNNNTLTFSLVVTNSNYIDLGVSNPLPVDPANGYFDFDIDNYGPGFALADSYLIKVYVDGEFDSSERNTLPLFPEQYTTWQWATDYLYPAGDHSFEITVESDLIDIDTENNSISFNMTVPSSLVVTDLKVSGLKITDEKNAVFKFKVKNKGPTACEKGDYTVHVSVDGLPDSDASNSNKIGSGVTALWEWQLAYLYSPGLHKIEIDVRPSGGDLKPDDNILLFQMSESGANLQVYNIPVFTSVVDNAFSTVLSAINGAPPYSWELSLGTLPPGIYLDGNGTFYGKPDVAGSYSFEVKCVDTGDASAFSDVKIVVLDAPPAEPKIIDTILPITFENTFFILPLNAVGGTAPYSWSFNGIVPLGISISSTGSLFGTITSSGAFQIPVKVSDDASATAEATLNLRVLKSTQAINYQITKLQITIPWKEHSAGNDNSDSIKLKAECPIPGDLVVDKYTGLTIYVGDYPFSFIKPSKSKLNKKATYKTDKSATEKGNASVKWKKDKIKISLSMKNIDLASPLAEYGLKENAPATLTIPIRISINDCDSG